jgi:ABC-type Fe3+ transport system permease subunit
MLILVFLVVYPVAMLLLGALTNTNPVVDGFGKFDLSLDNFVVVLANPNVHLALGNSLIACGGGTALAVVIGLTFSWVVVRTDTPCKGFIAAVSMLPLFVPPLVAAVAWSILASPRTGLLNVALGGLGIDWRFNAYSMGGLIAIFGIYYAPYVYMFTASALRNMDPSLEEAAEITWRLGAAHPAHRHLPADRPGNPFGDAVVVHRYVGHLRHTGGAWHSRRHPGVDHLHLAGFVLGLSGERRRRFGLTHEEARYG